MVRVAAIIALSIGVSGCTSKQWTAFEADFESPAQWARNAARNPNHPGHQIWLNQWQIERSRSQRRSEIELEIYSLCMKSGNASANLCSYISRVQ